MQKENLKPQLETESADTSHHNIAVSSTLIYSYTVSEMTHLNIKVYN